MPEVACRFIREIVMPTFPSVEWFKAIAEIVNKDENYRKLGTCDATVGIQVGERMFEVDFEAFEITEVKQLDATTPRDLDFTLVLSYDAWKDMIENIKRNGHADLTHTLNSIDLAAADEFARADDYYRRDKFYRFNQTFQVFFDSSARIETEFADPAMVGT
jgi:hypothetical protein